MSVEDLLKSRSFCHLNTLIVRRTLYEDIGGMEETIRWECDHDLYLRLIDRAAMMKFMPVVVSHHNIPDPAKKSSMTTGLAERLWNPMTGYFLESRAVVIFRGLGGQEILRYF